MLSKKDIVCPENLLGIAKTKGPAKAVIVNAIKPVSIESAKQAVDANLIIPVFIGDKSVIDNNAKRLNWDISKYEIINEPDENSTAPIAAKLASEGKVKIIVKGHIHTDVLMKAVLKRDLNLIGKKRLSHIWHMTLEKNDKPFIITDGALNVLPKLETKMHILKNSVDFAKRIGISRPKVSVLSATEEVLDSMPSSIDAKELTKRAKEEGIDADVYGPSIPMMFDVQDARPLSENVDGKSKMKPVENYGVKILSIGFFTKPDQAVIWRGPMASKALNQLIWDSHWGELDYMIVDLPPGTGDIHLSLVQAIPLTGAIVVSTPQDIALADAKKGVNMFQMDSIDVPVVGIVENMSYFVPQDLPEKKYYIFGKDGAKNLADQLDIKLLAQIPIVQSLREASDAGRPAVLQKNTEISNSFINFANEVVKVIDLSLIHISEPTRLLSIGCGGVVV